MATIDEMYHASAPAADGWTTIGPVHHPANDERGILIRNNKTGIYSLDCRGTLRSVPQEWARSAAAGVVAADKLRAWRESHDWTQADAARETGYSLDTWKSYETGRLAISPRVLKMMELIGAGDAVD